LNVQLDLMFVHHVINVMLAAIELKIAIGTFVVIGMATTHVKDSFCGDEELLRAQFTAQRSLKCVVVHRVEQSILAREDFLACQAFRFSLTRVIR
jgi:hypothetical protein